jgi:hypothetical protein
VAARPHRLPLGRSAASSASATERHPAAPPFCSVAHTLADSSDSVVRPRRVAELLKDLRPVRQVANVFAVPSSVSGDVVGMNLQAVAGRTVSLARQTVAAFTMRAAWRMCDGCDRSRRCSARLDRGIKCEPSPNAPSNTTTRTSSGRESNCSRNSSAARPYATGSSCTHRQVGRGTRPLSPGRGREHSELYVHDAIDRSQSDLRRHDCVSARF